MPELEGEDEPDSESHACSSNGAAPLICLAASDRVFPLCAERSPAAAGNTVPRSICRASTLANSLPRTQSFCFIWSKRARCRDSQLVSSLNNGSNSRLVKADGGSFARHRVQFSGFSGVGSFVLVVSSSESAWDPLCSFALPPSPRRASPIFDRKT